MAPDSTEDEFDDESLETPFDGDALDDDAEQFESVDAEAFNDDALDLADDQLRPVASPRQQVLGRLRKYWEAAVRMEASDLLIRPGLLPRLRIGGSLKNVEDEPFTTEQLENDIKKLLSVEQWDIYHRQGSVDFAYEYDEDNRFRVNIFQSRGQPAIAARRISSVIPSYSQLHLPPIMDKIAQNRQGLVLLCGVTGSGKSTTIASMLQEINKERACHILTLEDPIEYIFKSEKAIVNQREIGIDVPDFTIGLRALVRENPDVVLIGELRDHETFAAAIQAAETGHLVFGTIHSSSCSGAFSRIYNLFPAEERGLIREMLSSTLRALVYQRLLKSINPAVPRVPAVEVMLQTPAVQKYISDGREAELDDVIRNAQREGMIDYATSLVDLVNRELIRPKEAIAVARNADEVKMRLKGIKTSMMQ
jgi:twitching motility protein PilT